MTWNEIVEKLSDFWNHPIPIIGFTVGSLTIAGLLFLTKTSIGKKALNWCKMKIAMIEASVKEAIEAKDKIIAEKDAIIAEMKKDYEEKLAIVQLNKDKEREIIIAIAEQIHNVKIQKIIEEYKKIPQLETISDYVDELEKKYESKYDLLLKRLEELEHEEGKDSNTVKEKI